MKKEIKGRVEVETLINAFYDKVRADPMLGPIFNDIVKVNWEEHLPVMYDFWENVLFYSGAYGGNPMTVHQRLHAIAPLTHEHFMRWLELFRQTVDENFAGDKAEVIKTRAQSIATIMELKILHPPS